MGPSVRLPAASSAQLLQEAAAQPVLAPGGGGGCFGASRPQYHPLRLDRWHPGALQRQLLQKCLLAFGLMISAGLGHPLQAVPGMLHFWRAGHMGASPAHIPQQAQGMCRVVWLPWAACSGAGCSWAGCLWPACLAALAGLCLWVRCLRVAFLAALATRAGLPEVSAFSLLAAWLKLGSWLS